MLGGSKINIRCINILFIMVLSLFLVWLPYTEASSQDMVQLGLVGHWSNYYEPFDAIEVMKGEEFGGYGEPGVTYAFCATSNGIVVFSVKTSENDPNSTAQEVSFISFIPVSDCTDIAIQIVEQGHEKSIYAYITGSGGLYIRDITNPAFSYHVGTCDFPGSADPPEGVAVSGDYAYVIYGSFPFSKSALQVIAIHDKTNPEMVGICDIPGSVKDIAVSGDYAYVAAGSSGLQVISIQDKNLPRIAGACDTQDDAEGVEVYGEYAYVAAGSIGLRVISVHDPNDPVIVGTCDTQGFATGVKVYGDYAYVIDFFSGLRVISVHDPNDPVIVGTCYNEGFGGGVAVSGDYAYVAAGSSGLQVISIQDRNSPVIVGSSDTPCIANGVAVFGDYAYVAAGSSGLLVISIHHKNGPMVVGACDTLDNAEGVAVSGDYAYVIYGSSFSGIYGLHVISIHDPNAPEIVGTCGIPNETLDIAVSGEYAYVAAGDSGLLVISIRDKNLPRIVGTCDTQGISEGIAVSGNYAYVSYWSFFSGISGVQVISIHDPNAPKIVGTCSTQDFERARGVAVSGDYAYVTAGDGLRVIAIHDKNNPETVGTCDIQGPARGVAVSGDYAYVTAGDGLRVIAIHDKNYPGIVGTCDTLGSARGVAVSGEYAYVADGNNGLLQFKIAFAPLPEGKGNLILVAGGDINYKALSQQRTQRYTRKRLASSFMPGSHPSSWQITQAIATHVLNRFLAHGYMVCDIYYFNPDHLQDIDNDGIPNKLIVDDSTPNAVDLRKIIINWPQDHIANEGPLYIHLIGHAAEDRFLIMSDEIITARELRGAIDTFQQGYWDNQGIHHPGTNRPVVVIIESAAAGTFIDEITGPNITVITSTGTGASYTKPSFDSTLPYTNFTTALIDAYAPHLDPNTIPDRTSDIGYSHIGQSLKQAFLSARNTLETSGPPFDGQIPQMALPGGRFSALYFSKDGQTPFYFAEYKKTPEILSLTSLNEIPCYLALIAEYPSHTYCSLPQDTAITFFSSDPVILDPQTDIQKQGCWYSIAPRKNGRINLIAHGDPNLPLSAKIIIEVSIDDPVYQRDTDRMVILAAGYKGTGDYLWDSTNTIANHAYETFRAMGYTKEEINYYTPFLLQDLDNNGEFDEIDGYPGPGIFDSDACSPYGCSPFARISQSDNGIDELFIFLADHGSRGAFSINPKEPLHANYLVDQIFSIADKVRDKIILIYDACYSGSLITEIEKLQAPLLSQKLVAITSTDPNQIAYYLNQGLVSFSYPFFDELRLTHSLTQAFGYARETLPYANPDLSQGQTPCISDPYLAEQWDRDTTYFVNESRPIFGEVAAYRIQGNLHITADIFSLTGIKEVWAIIESAQNSMRSAHGEAVTESTLLSLSLSLDDPGAPYGGEYTLSAPDPCPAEATYLITLYAMDNSDLPKIASYHTGIEKTTENTTRALIISSDPNSVDEEIRQRFDKQIRRAQVILEGKGLNINNRDIIHIAGEAIESQDEFFNEFSQALSGISPIRTEKTLFLYFIGTTIFNENNTPCFFINQNVCLTPEGLQTLLPLDPNQRLLIHMDTPYAAQFLSFFDPNHARENWAGMASTDQGHLFFPLEGKSFPCFSNFFFSMVLSGATVAQAYRMAERAVSLTQQRPALFPKKRLNTHQAISRHLNYYLGTSAIRGEEYSLFTDCNARAVRIPGKTQYHLSLAAHPNALIDRAWAVLTSPPDPMSGKSLLVDFDPDTVQTAETGLLYTGTVSTGHRYYTAYFMAEGGLTGDTEKTWTEWKKIDIAHMDANISVDPYEPDDDPSTILFDENYEIIVNNPPRQHTFYNEYTDWCFFHAQKGHIYELYAQDLSEYGYFIQLALFYDPNTMVTNESGHYLKANNYLAFPCKESGYYLLQVTLASTYPPGGVEYILGIFDSRTQKYTTLLVEVVDPTPDKIHGVRYEKSDKSGYVHPWDYRFAYPDHYYYKFNECTPYEKIWIQVYEDMDYKSYLSGTFAELLEDSLNKVTIDLTGSINPNSIPEPLKNTNYYEIIEGYKDLIEDPQYPWDSNHPLPFGDMYPNFSPYRDFDGDSLSNLDEVLFYISSPVYPTVVIPINKGMNLFYLPSVVELPNILPRMDISYTVYWFDHAKRTWGWPPSMDSGTFKSNVFNALYASRQGCLYLDLKGLNHPILCLKGFLKPGHGDCADPNSIDTDLPDPYYFCTGDTSLEVIERPDMERIESINTRSYNLGSWGSTYRFFNRGTGKEYRFNMYEVYILHRD